MKIVIGADLVPTANSGEKFKNGEVDFLFTDVKEIMKNADRTVVNLECALTNSENAIKKFGPNLKAAPECAQTLVNAGVTDVALANNHMFDFGIEGMVETLETLDKAGLPYMGVGKNDSDSRKIYYVEQEGKKVAFVNVCEHEYTYATEKRMGANPFDPFLTMQDIREAKKNAPFVVVLYHGGKEHCRYPSPRLMNLCREMVLCGADVVLTQHSHCIGCYEEYEGGHILYGQGNFHFAYDQRTDLWNTSLLVELDIQEKVSIKFYPLILNEAQLSIAKGEKADEIMNGFYARSEELKTGEWKKGWHEFCVSMTELYERAVKSIGAEDNEYNRQFFSHFLDCEAHTDVWRELFPTWNQTNELDE